MSISSQSSGESKELLAEKKASFQEEHSEIREKAGVKAMEAGARVESGAMDIVGEEESGVNIAGEVSEKMREKNEGDSGGSRTSSAQQADDEEDANIPQIGELNIPEPKVMVRKVKTAIKQEIREAEKEIEKYQSKPIQHAYELSKAVSLVRKLKTLLSNLIYESYEFIRDLWMDIMHGKRITELVK